MKNNFKNKSFNNDKKFENQQEIRNAIVDRFSKHGDKVKYQFKLTIKS